MRAVFAGKLAFYVLLFGAIALVFTMLNGVSTILALPLGVPLLFGVVIATFFLTTLGLMLGAKYPNHETNDPEELSTSMPGIGFIFASLLYGLIGAYALLYFVSSGNSIVYVAFILMSILLTLSFVHTARSVLMHNVHAE